MEAERVSGVVRDTSGQDVLLDPTPGARKRKKVLLLAGGAGVGLAIVLALLLHSWMSSSS